ncbi:MAG: IS21-like element helper ATPase IstB [Bacteroidales bacterium]|nr:IS21-like element helper ATPase IstB [Bacteroidales bacterium]
MVQQIDLKLRQMRLTGMARGWQALNETKQVFELSFSEGLEILIEREEEERKNNRFNRMIKGARFRYQASLEELSYEPSRGLNKSIISDLATCAYIARGESVLITGATGCGKSFLASALGHQACLHGHNVIYFNTQKFMLRTKMARSDGSILKYFDKIAKASLVILDDFGLTRMEQQQQFDLMEIIEDRHGKASTIIVSQLPVTSWFDVISETTIADAILDRLVHSAYRIELKGESMRKKR